MRSRWFSDLAISGFVFLIVLAVYIRSSNITSYDSVWSIATAMSIIREGNTNLDEYHDIIEQTNIPHSIESVNGHIYNIYPVGTSLLAVPILFAIDQFSSHILSRDLNQYVLHHIPEDLELLIACFIAALAAVFIYRAARFFLDKKYSLLIAFIFAFCTSAWSTASRGLWQHGPSMLMLSLALNLILAAGRRPSLIQFVSLPLAFSYVIRPTNSLSIVLLTAFVFIAYRRYFWRYLLWAMVIAIPFIAFNLATYNMVLPSYYQWYKDFSTGTFFQGLVGNLFSPSRGLFIFSPILLLSGVGIVLKFKQRRWEKLDTALLGIILLHWIAISVWPIWWAGWSFGPRIFSDVIPYFIYFLIPVAASFVSVHGKRRAGTALAIVCLAGFSFFVHYRGANVPDVLRWNTQPLDVDQYPERVWDWGDVQFLRGVKWGTPIDLAISGVSIDQLDRPTYTWLGTNDLRQREFDAATALIAPPAPSWIILDAHQQVGKELTSLFNNVRPITDAKTVASHRVYHLYHFDLGMRILEAARQSDQAAVWSGNLYPDQASSHPIDLPVSFGRTVKLIGFQIVTGAKSSPVSVLTYWQAGEQIALPLQLFIHAIGPRGQIIAQQDQLDAPASDWRPGDLIAQVNRLNAAFASGPVWIEVGWYHPDSGERLPIIVDGIAVDDRLLLKAIER